MPCSTRPATSTPMVGARPATASPVPKKSSPATNGTAGPRRSASRPASTMTITLPSMNPLNTQPYRRSPPRSWAATGITVTTASASDATKVIDRTRPAVRARRCGAHSPSARPLLIPAPPPGPVPLRGYEADGRGSGPVSTLTGPWGQPSGQPDLAAVQPCVRLVVVLVEPHKLVVEHAVQTGGARIRPVAGGHAHPVGDLIEGELAECHRSEHPHAPGSRVDRVGDLLDRPAEHIGEDLAPHGRARAAADEPDRLQPP